MLQLHVDSTGKYDKIMRGVIGAIGVIQEKSERVRSANN